jgi:hypothetical protein
MKRLTAGVFTHSHVDFPGGRAGAGGRREEGGGRNGADDVGDRSAQRHAQAVGGPYDPTRARTSSALVAGLGDLPAVTQRLLRNQDDIGNAIKPILRRGSREEAGVGAA